MPLPLVSPGTSRYFLAGWLILSLGASWWPATDSSCGAAPVRVDQDGSANSQNWPPPIALQKSLEGLSEHPATQDWASRTLQLLELLVASDEVASPANAVVLKQLQGAMGELDQLILQLSSVPTNDPRSVQGYWASELKRVRYRMARRLAIWEPLYRNAVTEAAIARRAPTGVPTIATGHRKIHFADIDPSWVPYLLIEETETAFNSPGASAEQKRDASRRFLARLNSPVLSRDQRSYLREVVSDEAIRYFEASATEPVDYADVLRHIELHEALGSGATEYVLNSDYQSLLYSAQPADRELAAILDTHYRNANFRVTVSEQLINRLLPEMPEIAEPVSENILGARVEGRTWIRNQLRIGLIPDPERLHLRLESVGLANTSTTAIKSGFTIQNRGTSRFQVFKRLSIGRNGVSSEEPVAVSESSNRLVGMRGKLDPVPVVGWVARRVAKQKIDAQKPIADRYAANLLERTAEQRMQEEVERQVAEMESLVSENLIQPLVALEMEPEPVEMSTQPDEIVVRYRLAGRDQMAANSARPQAREGALLSMQIHQSAVNNFLHRMKLGEETFTPLELTQHLRRALGLEPLQGGMDEDAHIGFSSIQPIRVYFEEGQVLVELNLTSFQVGQGKTWRNLRIRSTYTPRVVGSTVFLDQQGEVSVKGRRLKLPDQIAIRAIFSNVFEDQYHFAPIPDSLITPIKSPPLEISELVSGNGWIGISLGESPAVAAEQRADMRRMGSVR